MLILLIVLQVIFLKLNPHRAELYEWSECGIWLCVSQVVSDRFSEGPLFRRLEVDREGECKTRVTILPNPMYLILPEFTLLYPTLLNPIIPYPILTYVIQPYLSYPSHTTPYITLPDPTVPCFTLFTLPYFTLPYPTLPCPFLLNRTFRHVQPSR